MRVLFLPLLFLGLFSLTEGSNWREDFSFKSYFEAVNSSILFFLFSEPANKDVVVGSRGYLFYNHKAAISLSQADSQFTKRELSAWKVFFARMREEFSHRDISYKLIFAPNKHTVFSAHLPDWVRKRKFSKNKTDQLFDLMGGKHPDLRSILDNLEGSYHKTDTHWTEYGASLYFGEFEFERTQMSGGDLANLLGLREVFAEEVQKIKVPASVSCTSVDPSIVVDEFSCSNENSQSGTALVFMDSFGVATVKAVAQLHSRVHFFWSDKIDLEKIDSLKPETVYQILSERKIEELPAEHFFEGSIYLK